ncbi:MAG: histidine triad nucleotide-binding protein [Gemmatimonadaceae bacterium]
MSPDCPFCGIARGDIPATLLASNEHCVAFRDLNPQAPVHVLIIPREHVASLNDVTSPELIGEVMRMAAAVAGSEGLSEQGYRVVLNTNRDGGQTVFHLHAHLLGGRAMRWPPG